MDLDRKALGKKPFDQDGEDHRGGETAGRMQSTTDPESSQQSRKAFITANTGRWTAGATSSSTSSPPTSTTSLRFLKSPTKSRCGWESCRSPWDWTRDATAQESPICWRRRESRASSAAGGTPTGRIAMANAASDAPLLRCLHLPGAEASLLEDRHPRWECQYSCDSKTYPRRTACFGASMARRRVERHVCQDALDEATALTKSEKGRRIYGWRKETIERSFVETEENHGLHGSIPNSV